MQARSGACPVGAVLHWGRLQPFTTGYKDRGQTLYLVCPQHKWRKKVLKIVFSFHLLWKKDKDSIRVMTSTGE
jgi:hypothetical protein